MNPKLKQFTHYTLISGLVAGGTGASLFGEEAASTSGTVHELPPYVVVATKTPLPLDRVSPSVSYIDSEEMEFWQDRQLADVLSRESGVAFGSNGAPGSLTSVFVRGSDSNHTSFFVDGRRMNPGLGGQYAIEHLTVDNIESVQFQKGASSVNYGSAGIGGVVDVQTTKAFDLDQNGGAVEASVGSYGYWSTAGNYAFSEGDFAVSVGSSYSSTENDRPNDHYKNFAFTPRVDYRLTENLSLEFLGQGIYSEKGNPNKITAPHYIADLNYKSALASPGLRYETDELNAHVFYSYGYTKSDGYSQSYPVGSFEADMLSHEFSSQLDYQVVDELLLSVGGVYRNDKISNLKGDGAYSLRRDEQVGGFVQALWNVTDRFELRGGGRYDHFSQLDNALTGNLEAIYNWYETKTAYFAKVASSYAPPTLLDWAWAGEDLKAESGRSFELGIRQQLMSNDLELAAVYFRTTVKDYLDSPPPSYLTMNSGENLSSGVELSADYLIQDGLSVYTTYTYLDAKDRTTGYRLVRRPRHTTQAGVRWEVVKSVRVGLNATSYIDRAEYGNYPAVERVEDFVVFNLVSDWDVTDSFTVFGRVDNLFNEDYALANGYPQLGVAGYLGARLNF